MPWMACSRVMHQDRKPIGTIPRKESVESSTLWEGFLRHFGCDSIEYVAIADGGGVIDLGDVELQVIPAHYMHSAANFNIYDPQAKILMSGDIGAALEVPGAPMFVDDFDEHVEKMRFFHQRWMPSNQAKRVWIDRVRELDIDILAPQHGRMFKGDDINRFLDWFESLQVGIAVQCTKQNQYGSGTLVPHTSSEAKETVKVFCF